MAISSVDVNRLKQVSTEMENLYTQLAQNERTMSETMEQVKKAWQGDAATTFINAYTQNAPEFANMSKLIQNAATTLQQIATNYNKQETSAADIVRSGLAKG